MEATWAISLLVVDLLGLLCDGLRRRPSTAISMPCLRAIGLAPAATLRMPSLDDGLGQHGGGGGAVTGDVVGLGGDLLDQLGAHVLEGVVELDLLGDGHAVVGDRRGAELLVQRHVAALGPQRHNPIPAPGGNA